MSGTHQPQHTSSEKYAESMMNLALLDPPKWGWPAIGGIADLLTPHERARRKETKKAFLNKKKKPRGRPPKQKPAKTPTDSQTAETPSLSLKSPVPTLDSAAPVDKQTPALENQDTKKLDAEESKKDDKDSPDDNKNKDEEAKENTVPEEINKSTTAEAKSDPTNGEKTPSKNAEQSQTSETTATLPASETKDTASTTAAAMTDTNPADQPTDSTTRQADQSKVIEETVEKAAADQSKASDEATEKAMADLPKPSDETAEKATVDQSKPTDAAYQSKPSDETAEKAMDEVEIVETETGERVLKIGALTENGSLDLYAYHRGREGMEPRDEATGELLCDVEPTDTNHKWDEPKYKVAVTVSFPLTDEDGGPRFEDTIDWFLNDPETPTPEAFAVSVAEEYGLSHGQTMDLAISVEQQINKHIRDNCGYADPVAIQDNIYLERPTPPPATICFPYGTIFNVGKPGTYCATVSAASRARAKHSKDRQSSGTQGSTSRRRDYGNTDDSVSRNQSYAYFDDEPVEDIYLDEVQKRMTALSRDDVERKCEESGLPPGRLQMIPNHVCHICHKRHNLVGRFACGFQSHSYCRTHLKNRLQVAVTDLQDELDYDHCPICAATCACSKCGRRREALAMQLKRLCQMQGASPADVIFEDMFTCFSNPQAAIRMTKQASTIRKRDSFSEGPPHEDKGRDSQPSTQEKLKSKPKTKSKPTRRSSIRQEEEDTKMPAVVGVKPSPTDFPREIRNGVDADPGTFLDYRTVFTAEGQIVKDLQSMPDQTTAKPAAGEPAPVVEDGNVDYCDCCRRAGDLLCCDYCPRAFHENCLDKSIKVPIGNERWECHLCKMAKEDLPEYTLTGQQSLSKICAAYSSVPASGDDLVQLSILSRLHEMLEKLMKTDFGVTFAVPVTGIPEYPKIIKQPMDLGTIGSRLLNGEYKKFYDARKSWADVHLAILKDIELVWNNCFTFNYEGSSISRMADVLRKRMLAMRAKSIDRDLPEEVINKVEEYVKQSRKERGKIAAPPPQLDGRPTSKFKITVKATKIGRSTKVAILDPETGMIVKIYSTMKSAFMAADFLQKKHKLALERTLKEDAFKDLVRRSADDPSLTLYGHRWLELEKLHADHVQFSPYTSSQGGRAAVFEVRMEDNSTYIFYSMDEATTFPRLASDIPKDELRKELAILAVGGEPKTIFGLKWRRRKSVADSKALHNEVVLAPFWVNNKSSTEPKEDVTMDETPVTKTVIVKEDRIIGRTIGGFESHDAAFQDWVYACRSSPFVPDDEITESIFHTYYLDGDRNVDGVVWKTVEAPVPPDDEHFSGSNSQRAANLDGDGDAEMSQGPSCVTNESEAAAPLEEQDKSVATNPVTEAESFETAVEPSEKLPEASGESQSANEPQVALNDDGASEEEGMKKRKRSDDSEEALAPNKNQRPEEGGDIDSNNDSK